MKRNTASLTRTLFTGTLLASTLALSPALEAAQAPSTPAARIDAAFPVGTVTGTYASGTLAVLTTPEGTPIKILHLKGTASEMGQQYGYLVGRQIPATWSAMMTYMGEQLNLTPAQAESKLTPMLDKAYGYMSSYITQDIKDELAGILTGYTARVAADGATGVPSSSELSTMLNRLLALTNVSDLNAYAENDSKEANKLMKTGTSSALDDFYSSQSVRGGKTTAQKDTAQKDTTQKTGASPATLGKTCSFFAAWGSRGAGNGLLASRNLDWATGTGLSNQSLITVYAPTNGITYSSFGYVGLVGAMAGMNEHGIVVSEVGSTSVLEKLKGQPWTLKLREVLAKSRTLDEALPFMNNASTDRVNRPTTLGYNFLVADGDPDGAGADARAATFETNGGQTLSYVYSSGRDGCRESATLYTYGRNGKVAKTDTNVSNPLVNSETGSNELDAAGQVRRFKQSNGQYVRDANGLYVEDPYTGVPMPTGKPLGCATWRGEEALSYAVRMYQTAANGPSGLEPRAVMNDSDSFVERYLRMYGSLYAYSTGTRYTDENGVTWVQPTYSTTPIGMPQAEVVSRAASLDSSIMNVVYDATRLTARVAYEANVSGQWIPAGDTSYVDINMAALFNY